jgi:4,5-dihydroxyphthalate decarboxylase
MTHPTLTAVSRTQGNNRALKEGVVRPKHYRLEFEDVPVLVQAFRRMVRTLEFDVCEMAMTTYLCAKRFGVGFTAIPVFLVRDFHHRSIVVNRHAGITTGKDLEGREVGVNRGYTVTTGVWARGVLQDEHGVDLDAVTWRPSGDEHVAQYRAPRNVRPLDGDAALADRVISGELPAAVGLTIDHPDVAPLVPAADEAGLRALRERGHYPINHLVVVRDELLAAHPDLAVDLFHAFAESKAEYVRALTAADFVPSSADDRTMRRVYEVTGADPLPYGIAANRATLDELIRHAVAQHILDEAPDVDALFAESTRELAG